MQGAGNTTFDQALQLKLGKKATGYFDYVYSNGYGNRLHSYYFKFKTSKRDSVYMIKSLKKNKSYQVRVRAYRKGGYSTYEEKPYNWGEWSAVKTMKTAKK